MFDKLEWNARRAIPLMLGYKCCLISLLLKNCLFIFRLNASMALCDDLRQPVSSSHTKWVAQISWERFDLESPNITSTSISTYSTAIPDMTSLTTAGQKLSQKNNCCKCSLLWLLVEFLENGSSDDHEIVNTHRGGGQSASNLPDMTSLAASGRLQKAIKIRKNGRKFRLRRLWVQF